MNLGKITQKAFVVTAFIAVLFLDAVTLDSLKQFNEGIEGKQSLDDISFADFNALQNDDDADQETNEDVDIFVAEIFPEQPSNFEQLFRPLVRYKKATLDLDAQIEPGINEPKQTEPSKHEQSNAYQINNGRFLGVKKGVGYQNTDNYIANTGKGFSNESNKSGNNFVAYLDSKNAGAGVVNSDEAKLKAQNLNEYRNNTTGNWAKNEDTKNLDEQSGLYSTNSEENEFSGEQTSGVFSGSGESGSAYHESSNYSQEKTFSYARPDTSTVESRRENISSALKLYKKVLLEKGNLKSEGSFIGYSNQRNNDSMSDSSSGSGEDGDYEEDEEQDEDASSLINRGRETEKEATKAANVEVNRGKEGDQTSTLLQKANEGKAVETNKVDSTEEDEDASNLTNKERETEPEAKKAPNVELNRGEEEDQTSTPLQKATNVKVKGDFSGSGESGSGYHETSNYSQEKTFSYARPDTSTVESRRENISSALKLYKKVLLEKGNLKSEGRFIGYLNQRNNDSMSDSSSGSGEDGDYEEDEDEDASLINRGRETEPEAKNASVEEVNRSKEEDQASKLLQKINEGKVVVTHEAGSEEEDEDKSNLTNRERETEPEAKEAANVEVNRGKEGDKAPKLLQKANNGKAVQTNKVHSEEEDEDASSLTNNERQTELKAKKAANVEVNRGKEEDQTSTPLQKTNNGKAVESNKVDSEEEDEDTSSLTNNERQTEQEAKKDANVEINRVKDGDKAPKLLQIVNNGKAVETNKADREEEDEDTSSLTKNERQTELEAKKAANVEVNRGKEDDQASTLLQNPNVGKAVETNKVDSTEEDEDASNLTNKERETEPEAKKAANVEVNRGKEKDQTSTPLQKANNGKAVETNKVNNAEEDEDASNLPNKERETEPKAEGAANLEVNKRKEDVQASTLLQKANNGKAVETRKVDSEEEDEDASSLPNKERETEQEAKKAANVEVNRGKEEDQASSLSQKASEGKAVETNKVDSEEEDEDASSLPNKERETEQEAKKAANVEVNKRKEEDQASTLSQKASEGKTVETNKVNNAEENEDSSSLPNKERETEPEAKEAANVEVNKRKEEDQASTLLQKAIEGKAVDTSKVNNAEENEDSSSLPNKGREAESEAKKAPNVEASGVKEEDQASTLSQKASEGKTVETNKVNNAVENEDSLCLPNKGRETESEAKKGPNVEPSGVKEEDQASTLSQKAIEGKAVNTSKLYNAEEDEDSSSLASKGRETESEAKEGPNVEPSGVKDEDQASTLSQKAIEGKAVDTSKLYNAEENEDSSSLAKKGKETESEAKKGPNVEPSGVKEEDQASTLLQEASEGNEDGMENVDNNEVESKEDYKENANILRRLKEEEQQQDVANVGSYEENKYQGEKETSLQKENKTQDVEEDQEEYTNRDEEKYDGHKGLNLIVEQIEGKEKQVIESKGGSAEDEMEEEEGQEERQQKEEPATNLTNKGQGSKAETKKAGNSEGDRKKTVDQQQSNILQNQNEKNEKNVSANKGDIAQEDREENEDEKTTYILKNQNEEEERQDFVNKDNAERYKDNQKEVSTAKTENKGNELEETNINSTKEGKVKVEDDQKANLVQKASKDENKQNAAGRRAKTGENVNIPAFKNETVITKKPNEVKERQDLVNEGNITEQERNNNLEAKAVHEDKGRDFKERKGSNPKEFVGNNSESEQKANFVQKAIKEEKGQNAEDKGSHKENGGRRTKTEETVVITAFKNETAAAKEPNKEGEWKHLNESNDVYKDLGKQNKNSFQFASNHRGLKTMSKAEDNVKNKKQNLSNEEAARKLVLTTVIANHSTAKKKNLTSDHVNQNNIKNFASTIYVNSLNQKNFSQRKDAKALKHEEGDLGRFRTNVSTARKNSKQSEEKDYSLKSRKATKLSQNLLHNFRSVQKEHLPDQLLSLPREQFFHESKPILKKSKAKSKKRKSKKKKGQHRHFGKKKHHSSVFQLKNDVGFEKMLVSKKARQLYLHLIHDTRKAFLNRKHRIEKMRRKHFAHKKAHRHTKAGNFKNHAKTHYRKVNKKPDYQKSKSEYNKAMKKSKQNYRKLLHRHHVNNLAHRILNTMTENDKQILHETFPAPSTIHAKGNDHEKPELLDSKGSLLDKLAELKYKVDDHKTRTEILESSRNNLDYSSVVTEGSQNQNPTKSVQQEPQAVGLADNVDMDKLEGKKEKYEYKLLDEKIEGEVAKNENEKKNNQEADIDQLSLKQVNNSLKNLTEPETSNGNESNALNIYNEEESLKNNDIENEEDDITNSMYLQSLEKHLNHLYGSDASRYGAQLKESNLNLKRKLNHLYFLGNTSLWRNHPVVSMDISPLVEQFYIVNHKNLIDLVENKTNTTNNNNIMKHSSRKQTNIQIRKIIKEMMRLKKKLQAEKNKQHNKEKVLKHHKKKPVQKKTNMHKKKMHKKAKHKNMKHKNMKHKNMKHKNMKHKKMQHKKNARLHASLRSELNTSQSIKHASNALVPSIKNNMPKDVNYYMIEDAKKLGAVCIDGSIPGYYYRKGFRSGTKKWIIHLHGGAWCYNPETCYRRRSSLLGSTRHWSAENITYFFQGVLSDKKEMNPNFYDWNIVVQAYCDGGLFSGKRKEPFIYKGKKMYFRGRAILKAMIDSLNRRGIKEASEILLSGTSAGGLAVILQGEYMKRKLPKAANVKALVDAGFFVDARGQEWLNTVNDQFKGLFAMHQPKLKSKCEKSKAKDEQFKCLFPQYFLPYIKRLPIFFLNSLYDHWQLSELQGLHCVYNNDKCSPKERQQILKFRSVMFSAINETLHNMKSVGLFVNSCIAHGQAIVDYTWSRVRINNKTIGEAVNDWLKDNRDNGQHVYKDCRYPCNGSCPKPMVNLCVQNFKAATMNIRTRRYAPYAELC